MNKVVTNSYLTGYEGDCEGDEGVSPISVAICYFPLPENELCVTLTRQKIKKESKGRILFSFFGDKNSATGFFSYV